MRSGLPFAYFRGCVESQSDWDCLNACRWCGCAYLLSLAAVDVLDRDPMKDAAKCDMHKDVRNSVNCRIANA